MRKDCFNFRENELLREKCKPAAIAILIINIRNEFYNGNYENAKKLIEKLQKEQMKINDETSKDIINQAFQHMIYFILHPDEDDSPNPNRKPFIGNEELLIFIVSKIKKCDWIDPKTGFTALISAANQGYGEVVRSLIKINKAILMDEEYDEYIWTKNVHGYTALNAAAKAGHLEIIKILMEEKLGISIPNEKGHTPVVNLLDFFCEKCRRHSRNGYRDEEYIETISLLLGDEALELVGDKDHNKLLTDLIEKNKDVLPSNFVIKIMGAILNSVIRSQQEEIVSILLETAKNKIFKDNNIDFKATINYKNHKGYTLLNEAIYKKDEKMIRLLLARGANIECEDNYGCAALNVAARAGNLKIVQLLLQRMEDINRNKYEIINHKSISGFTALNTAAFEGNLDMVDMLIKAGADTSIQNKSGYTPMLNLLYNFCQNKPQCMDKNKVEKYTKTISVLLDKTADVLIANQKYNELLIDLIKKNKDILPQEFIMQVMWTELELAVNGGYQEIVKILLNASKDIFNGNKDTFKVFIEKQDANGNTVLNLAAKKRSDEIVKMLLQVKADHNKKDENGFTPLDLAIQSENFKTIKILIDEGVNINSPNSSGSTSVFVELLNKFCKRCKREIDMGESLENINNYEGYIETINLFLDNPNIDLIGSNHNVNSVLINLAIKNHDILPKDLLKKIVEGILTKAVQNGKVEGVIKLFIDNPQFSIFKDYYFNQLLINLIISNKDILSADLVNKIMTKALNQEVQQEQLENLKMVIKAFPISLIRAVKSKNEERISALIKKARLVMNDAEYKEYINYDTGDKLTAIEEAIRSRCKKTVDMLIEAGADIKNPNPEELIKAVKSKNEERISVLIKKARLLMNDEEYMAYINYDGGNNFTAIEEAMRMRTESTVRILIEAGADIKNPNRKGFTVLETAINLGMENIVRMLIEAGADIKNPNRKGFTVLESAINLGMENIAKILIEAGANINHKKNDGYTVINMAVCKGYTDIVKSLIAKGANINDANNNGYTPLSSAAARGYEEIVRMLLETGKSSLNYQDYKKYIDYANNYGFTALSSAVFEGHEKIVIMLIEAGADIEKSTKDGFTPLSSAICKGNLRIAKILINAGANINVTDTKKRSLIDAVICNFLQEKEKKGIAPERLKEYIEIIDLFLRNPRFNIFKNYHSSQLIINLVISNKDILPEDLVNKIMTKALNEEIKQEQSESLKMLIKAFPEEFIKAIRSMDEGRISALIKKARLVMNDEEYMAYINYDRGDNLTALEEAMRTRSENIVRLLIAGGVDIRNPNKRGVMALELAINFGMENMAKIFIELGAEIDKPTRYGFRLLFLAIYKGDLRIAKILINAGANIDITEAQIALCNFWKERQKGITIERYQEYIEFIQLLLYNPRFNLIEDQSYELLFKDLNFIRIQSINPELMAQIMCRMLDVAVDNSRGKVVELLLRVGMAMYANNPSMFYALINRNVNTYSPLAKAIDRGQLKIIKILIMSGADISSFTYCKKKPAIFNILYELCREIRSGIAPARFIEYIEIINLFLTNPNYRLVTNGISEIEVVNLARQNIRLLGDELVNRIINTLVQQRPPLQEKTSRDGYCLHFPFST